MHKVYRGLPASSVMLYCKSPTAHFPRAVRCCRSSLPTSLGKGGSVQQEFHGRLPKSRRAVCCRGCNAHYTLPLFNTPVHCGAVLRGFLCSQPRVVRWCTSEIPPPTVPGHYGSAMQEFHCPLP